MDKVTGLEYKSGLFLFYVVIMSKYFEDMISCDLQRYMERSIIPRHIIAFMTAFFTIVLTEYGNDENNTTTLLDYLQTTFIIYFLFLFSTKAKAEFVFPMLFLLLGDQILKVYNSILEKKVEKAKSTGSDVKQTIDIITYVRNILSYVILGIIGVGSFSYFIRQYSEFGSNFSFSKFILGTFKCNMNVNTIKKN
jgi:hypothetical protein